MTDNLNKDRVDFPYKPKARNVGKVDVDNVVGGLASTSALSYTHRPYANPLVTTAALLKTSGKVMRRARKLRKQLYDSISYNFAIKTSDMDDAFGLSSSISFSDIMDMMKKVNMPRISEGERHKTISDLIKIMKYLWYPNSNVNDVQYCKNARMVLGFIISNDIVKEVDRAIHESLLAYSSYSMADANSGGMSLNKTFIREDCLSAIVDGSEGASKTILEAAYDIELGLSTKIDGKAFWQKDQSGIIHYSMENEVAFLGKALSNSGVERDSISAMNIDNTNRWITDRLSTIRGIMASRYDYNKVTHTQMKRVKSLNNIIGRLYSTFGVSINDILGTGWSNDISLVVGG
jgi:hypothetical protein